MNTELKIALSKFKTDIKLVSGFITQYKKTFKEWQRTGDKSQIESVLTKYSSIAACIDLNRMYPDFDIMRVKSYARHMHVAYSLLKGNQLPEIEKTIKWLNVDLLKANILTYIDSTEIINSIDCYKNSGFISGILAKIKGVCHG